MKRTMTILMASIFLAGIANFAGICANHPKGTQVQKNRERVQRASKELVSKEQKKIRQNRQRAKEERQRRKSEINKEIGEKKENKGNAQEQAQKRIDRRQETQEKRIQHGINKGYLTDEEIAKLNSQQEKIAELENSFESNGKLTKEECLKLRKELNTASANIWLEKHDTEGKQMPTYRLGENVFLKDSIAEKLSGEIPSSEAKKITGDFKNILSLKKQLSNGNLSEEQRNKLQTEYDELLNDYFEVR